MHRPPRPREPVQIRVRRLSVPVHIAVSVFGDIEHRHRTVVARGAMAETVAQRADAGTEHVGVAGARGRHRSGTRPPTSRSWPNAHAGDDDRIDLLGRQRPDQRYTTTVELADATREAITVPIPRAAPAPTLVPTTRQVPNRVSAQPMSVTVEASDPAELISPPLAAAPIPTRCGKTGRRTSTVLVAGGFALVAMSFCLMCCFTRWRRQVRIFLCAADNGWGLCSYRPIGVLHRILVQRMKRIRAFQRRNGIKIRERLDAKR